MMANVKNVEKTNVGKVVENLEPLCIDGGNWNAAAAVENNLVVPQKVKHEIITICSSKYTSTYIPKRHESRDSNICTPIFVAAVFT